MLGWTSWASGQLPDQRSLSNLHSRYNELATRFTADMLELARQTQAAGFPDEAQLIVLRSEPLASQTLDIDKLPLQVLPDISPALPETERIWRLRQRQLETAYAAELYRLSRDAITRSQASFAFALIRETAFHDPDHRYARGMLGYIRSEDEWTTLFASQMQRKGMVDHPQFGWIPDRHVQRYEQGERFVDGRWMSAEKEAALRSDFAKAWEVESEHFVVLTNHSLESGVQISRELERYHQFFRREFAAFFATPQQMAKLFEKGGSAQMQLKHRVYYFRNREEYIATLKSRQPQIDGTNGLYMPQDRIAYLYHDPERVNSMATIYHEVAHQFVGETTSRYYDVAQEANFWIIEGFASYMESVRQDERGLHVGTPHDDRIYWAQKYFVDENFQVPMRQFTSLGMNDFRAVRDLWTRYYSQSAGMVHFFLHYQDGVYREAFLAHLAEVYSPIPRTRNNPTSLEKLTGVAFETLDQQYRDYISTLPAAPTQIVKPAE